MIFQVCTADALATVRAITNAVFKETGYIDGMVLEQFYLGCLAHASYLVASNGEAAVIDPQRDVEIYLEAARRLGVKIRHIFETHLHADFVSGHVELGAKTGARIYLGEASHAGFEHVDVLHDHEVGADEREGPVARRDGEPDADVVAGAGRELLQRDDGGEDRKSVV